MAPMVEAGGSASRPNRDTRDGDSKGYQKVGKTKPDNGKGSRKGMDKGAALACMDKLSGQGQNPVQDMGMCIWACNTALYKFADDRDVAGAERLLAKMRITGIQINRSTLNIMIRACANDGDGPGAEHWLEEIMNKGFVPTVTSYCGVILAWAKAGRLDKVELWISRLSDAGICPPKKICRPVVRILMAAMPVGSSHIPTADVATAWLHHAYSLGVPLDRRTINLMMATYARAGNIEKTENWALFMQKTDITPNSTTLSALVTASRKAGNQERANMWMERMAQLGFEPLDLETPQETDTDPLQRLSTEVHGQGDDSDEETATSPNNRSMDPEYVERILASLNCAEYDVVSSPGAFAHRDHQKPPTVSDIKHGSMPPSGHLAKDMMKPFQGLQYRNQRPAVMPGMDMGMLGCSETAPLAPAVRELKPQQAAVPAPPGLLNIPTRERRPKAPLSTIVASYELPNGPTAQGSSNAPAQVGLRLQTLARRQPTCSLKGTTAIPVVAY